MTYEEVISGFRSFEAKDFEDDVPERLHKLVNALMELPSPERAVPELFDLVERLPDADFGSPGPLVHTLERMDHTSELIASVRRRPTALSVWMVNRTLNSSLPLEQRRIFLDLLASVADHPNADESACEQAADFIAYQAAKT